MKTIRSFVGVLALGIVGCEIMLLTIFDVIELSLFVIGDNYNKDLLAMGIFTLPLLVFSWIAFTSEWAINKFSKFINN